MKETELISIIFSTFSLFISILALYISTKKLSVSKKEHLDQLVNQINNNLVKYEVVGPVTRKVSEKNDKEDRLQFQKKAVSFLHHINYFQTAFEGRTIIGKKHFKQIDEWFTDVVIDWVKNDQDLIAVWKHLEKTNDFQNPKFAKFIKKKMKKI